MNMIRLILALVAVNTTVGRPMADDTGPLKSLREEVADIQESTRQLVERQRMLETRLDTLTEKSATADRGQETWKTLVSQDVMAIGVGPSLDRTVTIATSDRTHNLQVFRLSRTELLQRWSTSLDTATVPRIAAADLDEDGDSEILLVTDRLDIYRPTQNEFGLAWSSHESFPTTDVPAPRIGIADFNGDGLQDVAILNYKDERDQQTESLYIYTRTLSQPLDFGLTGVLTLTDDAGYHFTAGLAIADFTLSGKAEIVIGNDNGNLWLTGFEDGKLVVKSHWRVSGGAVGPGLSVGNLDDDYGPELLVGTNGGDVHIYAFAEDSQPRLLASAAAGRLAYGVGAGDVDGDGQEELILTRGHRGYAGMTSSDVVAEVWKLTGRELVRVWREETVDLPRPIVYDLNGDNRAEIIVHSAHGGNPMVLEPRW